MKIKKKKLRALLLSSLCCFALLTGCSSGKESASAQKAALESIKVDPAAVEQGLDEPLRIESPGQNFDISYMGLNISLPKSLVDRMEKKEVAMFELEDETEDETMLSYAVMKWKTLEKEQRELELESLGMVSNNWAEGLEAIGAIGVYQSDAEKDIDKLTNCTEHKEIGKSEDGSYTYYLSVNPDAEPALQDEINAVTYQITTMEPIYEQPSVGEFSTEDILGEAYTQEMFADYDLTMVNVFATWCSPCVNEIPDLEKLYKEMADQGVNVVGIVLDAIDGTGSTDPETIEIAKVLAERTGATYPFLIPDKGYLNGRLSEITAVPETFFVDKKGNLVGETYTGSRSFEEWKSIVKTELEEVEQ